MIHVLMPFSREHFRDVIRKHLLEFKVNWIPLEYETQTKEPAYEKINKFIQLGDIQLDDYYCILCDDDHYEEHCFDNFPENKDSEVIFISMKRGDSVLKQMKFKTDTSFADGHMAIWLKENFKCSYEPYRYVLFNYLEAGRYNK